MTSLSGQFCLGITLWGLVLKCPVLSCYRYWYLYPSFLERTLPFLKLPLTRPVFVSTESFPSVKVALPVQMPTFFPRVTFTRTKSPVPKSFGRLRREKQQIGKPYLSVRVRLCEPRPMQYACNGLRFSQSATPLMRPAHSASSQCSFGTQKACRLNCNDKIRDARFYP